MPVVRLEKMYTADKTCWVVRWRCRQNRNGLVDIVLPLEHFGQLDARVGPLRLQANGFSKRVRDRLHVAPDLPDEELVALARASERVRAFLDGREAARTVVVPGKLVNFVT